MATDCAARNRVQFPLPTLIGSTADFPGFAMRQAAFFAARFLRPAFLTADAARFTAQRRFIASARRRRPSAIQVIPSSARLGGNNGNRCQGSGVRKRSLPQ